MLDSVLLLILGFAGIILGAKLLLHGSVNIGRLFNIPKSIIGLVVVSLGTSLPELMMSIQSSLHNKPEILISNLIGSNIFNLYFILGLCAIFSSINISNWTIRFEFFISLLLSTIPVIFIANNYDLNWVTGLVLLIIWLIFIFVSWKVDKNTTLRENSKISNNNLITCFSFILGCFLLWFGSDIVLQGADSLANSFNVSDSFIGFTVLAIGTGLPELTTSLMAILKKEMKIAIGNVIGSNILNLSFILGISLIIQPINPSLLILKEFVLWIALQFIFLSLVFIFTKYKISKIEAMFMLAIYIASFVVVG